MKAIKRGKRREVVGRQRERQRQKATVDSHSRKTEMHKSLASMVKISSRKQYDNQACSIF
jgi:hypothetical protein